MKVIMKPIEVIASFSLEGKPTPIKFKTNDQNGSITVRVDRIVDRSDEKIAGNPMLLFLCESCIDDVQKRYEIKYEVATCKWYLSKT